MEAHMYRLVLWELDYTVNRPDPDGTVPPCRIALEIVEDESEETLLEFMEEWAHRLGAQDYTMVKLDDAGYLPV